MNLFRKWIEAILTFLTYAAPGTTALMLTLLSFVAAVGVWAIFFNVYHEYGIERLLPIPDDFWEPKYIGVLWGVMMVIGVWFLFDRRGKTVRSSVGEDSVRFRVGEDRVHSLDIPQAKKRVWLLGLSLLPFANERYIRQLKEAMTKRGVEVHILLLDPESEVALSRHKQLYEGDRTLPDDIRGALQSFEELGKSIARDHRAVTDKFKLGVYQGNACMSAFMVDDEVHVGIYVDQVTGLETPEIHVVNRGAQCKLFSTIETHMKSVCDRAILTNFDKGGTT